MGEKRLTGKASCFHNRTAVTLWCKVRRWCTSVQHHVPIAAVQFPHWHMQLLWPALSCRLRQTPRTPVLRPAMQHASEIMSAQTKLDRNKGELNWGWSSLTAGSPGKKVMAEKLTAHGIKALPACISSTADVSCCNSKAMLSRSMQLHSSMPRCSFTAATPWCSLVVHVQETLCCMYTCDFHG